MPELRQHAASGEAMRRRRDGDRRVVRPRRPVARGKAVDIRLLARVLDRGVDAAAGHGVCAAARRRAVEGQRVLLAAPRRFLRRRDVNIAVARVRRQRRGVGFGVHFREMHLHRAVPELAVYLVHDDADLVQHGQQVRAAGFAVEDRTALCTNVNVDGIGDAPSIHSVAVGDVPNMSKKRQFYIVCASGKIRLTLAHRTNR